MKKISSKGCERKVCNKKTENLFIKKKVVLFQEIQNGFKAVTKPR